MASQGSNQHLESDGSYSTQVRTVGGSGGSTAATIADGADVAQGAVADAAVITDANGTLSAKLRGLVVLLLAMSAKLPATLGQKTGANSLAVVLASDTPAPSRGYTSSVSVTRPANTNTYAANDVVGIAGNAAITFANAFAGAGEHLITSVSFERDVTALISGETSYVLHLYSVTPPSGLADEAAFDLPSGDRASYLGFVNLGTPVDLGSTLYVEQNGINKQITAASTSLFAYLVTVGTYVAASASVHKIVLHSVAL